MLAEMSLIKFCHLHQNPFIQDIKTNGHKKYLEFVLVTPFITKNSLSGYRNIISCCQLINSQNFIGFVYYRLTLFWFMTVQFFISPILTLGSETTTEIECRTSWFASLLGKLYLFGCCVCLLVYMWGCMLWYLPSSLCFWP